jgi:hypothetical protein
MIAPSCDASRGACKTLADLGGLWRLISPPTTKSAGCIKNYCNNKFSKKVEKF